MSGAVAAASLSIVASLSWVLLKPGPSPGATLANRGLFLLIAVVAASFARWAWLRVAPERRFVASALFLYFFAVVVLFTAHLAGVATLPFHAEGLAYDFRAYSLLLLGVAGLVPGVRGTRAVVDLVRVGETRGRETYPSVLWLLAINAPLMPLQDFAVAFTIGGVGAFSLARSVR